MNRILGTVSMLGVLLCAVPAAAQTSSSGVPSGPIINDWYIGANTGATVVEKVGAIVGGEAGLRVWRSLDAVAEIAWMQNVVTRRHLDGIERLATHLGDVQGSSASGSLSAPALYGGVGGRWVIEQDGLFKPYGMVTIGAARVKLEPKLALGGTNVADAAAQYGITLGRDLTGTSSHFAAELGLGVVMGFGTWYVDGGARLLSIAAPDQRINVARLVVGGGYRF